MAQPEFVPIVEHDRRRVGERIPPVQPGGFDRPGQLHPGQPSGPQFGVIGPDQGYALKLARHLQPGLVLRAHEEAEDVIAGCVEVALRRAARFGRAPVVYDLEMAFNLFGYLGPARDDLAAFRQPRFDGVAHRYTERLALGSLVPDETLVLTPAAVASKVAAGDWQSLLRV